MRLISMKGKRMAPPTTTSHSLEPRVVICDRGEEASVEVLELPRPVEIGTEFKRQGKTWRIIADRPRTRVLLAQLLSGACLA